AWRHKPGGATPEFDAPAPSDRHSGIIPGAAKQPFDGFVTFWATWGLSFTLYLSPLWRKAPRVWKPSWKSAAPSSPPQSPASTAPALSARKLRRPANVSDTSSARHN